VLPGITVASGLGEVADYTIVATLGDESVSIAFAVRPD
jgi:hypothetical protein